MENKYLIEQKQNEMPGGFLPKEVLCELINALSVITGMLGTINPGTGS